MIDNLFDDDILISDDSSSVFNDTGVESLTNLIGNNITKFRKNTYLNMKGANYDVWRAYLNETKGMYPYGYWNSFSYKVNNPYSVTLKIKSLNGFKWHNRHTDYKLGIIDINLFKCIPYIRNIELESIYEDKTRFNDIIFMNMLNYNNHKDNRIDKSFVDNLQWLEEIRNDYQIKNNISQYIGFQGCTFDGNSMQYLNDNIPNNFDIIITSDCDIFINDEYINVGLSLNFNKAMNGFDWNTCNKISLYREPIFKNN